MARAASRDRSGDGVESLMLRYSVTIRGGNARKESANWRPRVGRNRDACGISRNR